MSYVLVSIISAVVGYWIGWLVKPNAQPGYVIVDGDNVLRDQVEIHRKRADERYQKLQRIKAVLEDTSDVR